MAAPASEDLRELERELELAAESGEPLTRAAIQDRFQVAAGEAQGMLDTLREHGKAVEIAPGEWQGPTLDEIDHGGDRVLVSVPDGDGDGGENGAGDGLELESPRFEALRAGVGVLTNVEPTVRLTRTIAESLSEDALGQLVKAGLGDVADGETFLLEVTP